jgi:hypothetical protein
LAARAAGGPSHGRPRRRSFPSVQKTGQSMTPRGTTPRRQTPCAGAANRSGEPYGPYRRRRFRQPRAPSQPRTVSGPPPRRARPPCVSHLLTPLPRDFDHADVRHSQIQLEPTRSCERGFRFPRPARPSPKWAARRLAPAAAQGARLAAWAGSAPRRPSRAPAQRRRRAGRGRRRTRAPPSPTSTRRRRTSRCGARASGADSGAYTCSGRTCGACRRGAAGRRRASRTFSASVPGGRRRRCRTQPSVRRRLRPRRAPQLPHVRHVHCAPHSPQECGEAQSAVAHHPLTACCCCAPHTPPPPPTLQAEPGPRAQARHGVGQLRDRQGDRPRNDGQGVPGE